MRRGFTLLEVVLALSLTVILLGASTTFLWELADRRSTLARGSRDLHAGAVLMERIEADLSAGLVGDPGVGTGVEGTETRLKLLTRGVWLAPAEGEAEDPAAQGDLQASEFVFDPAAGRLSARRYAVKPGSGGGAGGELELISDRVERVRFRYYDGRGWRSSFDRV
jgi:prepilin-type N-terminal cleavage/methylation domain-containing protein